MSLYRLEVFALAFFAAGFLALIVGVLILIACQENGVYPGRLGLIGLVSLIAVCGSAAGLATAWRVKDPRADAAILADYDDRAERP